MTRACGCGLASGETDADGRCLRCGTYRGTARRRSAERAATVRELVRLVEQRRAKMATGECLRP